MRHVIAIDQGTTGSNGLGRPRIVAIEALRTRPAATPRRLQTQVSLRVGDAIAEHAARLPCLFEDGKAPGRRRLPGGDLFPVAHIVRDEGGRRARIGFRLTVEERIDGQLDRYPGSCHKQRNPQRDERKPKYRRSILCHGVHCPVPEREPGIFINVQLSTI